MTNAILPSFAQGRKLSDHVSYRCNALWNLNLGQNTSTEQLEILVTSQDEMSEVRAKIRSFMSYLLSIPTSTCNFYETSTFLDYIGDNPIAVEIRLEDIFDYKSELPSTAPEWQKVLTTSSDRNPNSTLSGVSHKLLKRRLQALFAAGRNEIFEDGMESEFSKNLLSLIDQNVDSEMIFDIIGELIQHKQVSTEVAAESLQWIGRIDNPRTENTRRIMLENCLRDSDSSRVKDGAIVGLSLLDNVESIHAIQKAINKEAVPQLRENMEQVLEQLAEKAKGIVR